MRTVVVTGATSGIGRATALDLAAHGFRVVATARTGEKAAKLTAAAAEAGLELRTVLLDVTDPGSCQDAVAEIDEQTGGGPWALVNNAGVAAPGAVEDVAEADARQVLEVNLLGAARLTRLVLPGMARRGGGRIVQISSVAGRVATPLNGWYCASKHALEALTDALRCEVAARGIRVSLVEPGCVDTPLLTGALAVPTPADSVHGAARAATRRLLALHRPVPPERVARAVRRALLAPRPRRRYGVGPEAAVAPLVRLAPAAVADTVVRAVLRINAG
ncbi:SDR family oxidoreductase [Kitasatospora sp. NPDC059795]|uniref:SDR family oxidoreductase n=1 Tax=Kitasatospora sp. NPDC059795 TaxID=3346949 RepID=UPI003651C3A4